MQTRSEILIARLFWKTTFKNKAVFTLALLMGMLWAYAAFSGWVTFKNQNDMRARYQAQARKDWLDNPDKHPHRMAHYGHFAFRPKPPLSLFDFGMESFFGNAVFLEAHVQNTTNFSEAGFSTGLLRFGEISIAMILQLLLPMLIFFLGFSSIAAERENGTLKMLMSQGVGWRQLILGKTLGMLAVVQALYLPVMLTTLVLISIAQGSRLHGDERLRLLLLGLSYLVYLSVFCVIAVLVSAVSKTSKTALVSLIGVWLLFTIVLPRASQSLGAYLYKIPSKARFHALVERDVIKAGDSHNPNDPQYKALQDSVLAAHHADSVQQLPFNYSGFRMWEGEKRTSAIYNHHLESLRQVYEKQNRFSKLMAFVNPYTGIKNLSMALAGTDNTSYVDFQNQAEQYRYQLSQHMNELQMRYISNKSVISTERPDKIDRKHWASVEEFNYRPPTIASVFQTEAISLLSLLFWVGLLAILVVRLSKTLTAL